MRRNNPGLDSPESTTRMSVRRLAQRARPQRWRCPRNAPERPRSRSLAGGAALAAIAFAMLGGWGASAAQASAYGDQDLRWPNGTVYYAFDPAVPSHVRSATAQAVSHYNAYTYITGVTILPRTDPFAAHVKILPTTGPSRVSQNGYPSGPSTGRPSTSMWLNTATPAVWQSVVHQFGHVIGLSHEHQRCERDAYVNAPYIGEMAKECELPTAELYNTMSIMHDSVAELATFGAYLEPDLVAPEKNVHPGLVDSDLRTIATMYRSDGTFSVVSAMHGKCLDAPKEEHEVRDPTSTRMLTCERESADQRWVYSAASGELKTHDRCLDSTSGQPKDAIVMRDCNGTAQQQWDIGTYGGLVMRAAKDATGRPLCAEIVDADREDGAQLMLQHCHRGDNQQWRRGIDGTGGSSLRLVSDLVPPAVTSAPRRSKCMDVPSSSPFVFTVYIYDCNDVPTFVNQRVVRTADAELRIFNKCVDGETGQVGDTVTVRPCDGSVEQRWEMTETGTLQGVNGLCIAVKNPAAFNTTQMALANCGSVLAQRWSIRDPR